MEKGPIIHLDLLVDTKRSSKVIRFQIMNCKLILKYKNYYLQLNKKKIIKDET